MNILLLQAIFQCTLDLASMYSVCSRGIQSPLNQDRKSRGVRLIGSSTLAGHACALSALPLAPNGGREVDGSEISDNRIVASFRLTPLITQE